MPSYVTVFFFHTQRWTKSFMRIAKYDKSLIKFPSVVSELYYGKIIKSLNLQRARIKRVLKEDNCALDSISVPYTAVLSSIQFPWVVLEFCSGQESGDGQTDSQISICILMGTSKLICKCVSHYKLQAWDNDSEFSTRFTYLLYFHFPYISRSVLTVWSTCKISHIP